MSIQSFQYASIPLKKQVSMPMSRLSHDMKTVTKFGEENGKRVLMFEATMFP